MDDHTELQRVGWLLTNGSSDPADIERLARSICGAVGLDPDLQRYAGPRGYAWNPHTAETPYDGADDLMLPTWCFFSNAASRALSFKGA